MTRVAVCFGGWRTKQQFQSAPTVAIKARRCAPVVIPKSWILFFSFFFNFQINIISRRSPSSALCSSLSPQGSPSVLLTSAKWRRNREREREREYKSDIYYTSVPIQHGHSSEGLPVTGHHQARRQLSLLPLLLLLIGATATK